jgi:hypothetical protein
VEINPKYLFLGIIVILIGVWVSGYLSAPMESVEENPINLYYIGSMNGKCNPCTLLNPINASGTYVGGIRGEFYGKIMSDGKESYANLTITDGNFTGDLAGDYDGTNIIGSINGQANAYVTGTIVKTVQKGVSFPQESIWWGGGLLTLLVLYQVGLLQKIFNFGGKDDFEATGISEPEDQIFDKLKEYIYTRTGDSIQEVREVMREPPRRPIKITFYILLTNLKMYRVSYNGKGRFSLPIYLKENEFKIEEMRYAKLLEATEQSKVLSASEIRERVDEEVRKRRDDESDDKRKK